MRYQVQVGSMETTEQTTTEEITEETTSPQAKRFAAVQTRYQGLVRKAQEQVRTRGLKFAAKLTAYFEAIGEPAPTDADA